MIRVRCFHLYLFTFYTTLLFFDYIERIAVYLNKQLCLANLLDLLFSFSPIACNYIYTWTLNTIG